MDVGNQTAFRDYRFLDDSYFSALYEAFIEAFSDYVFPFALTEVQFRNHINLNAVDLGSTVGCVEGGRLIGFSLNGFGEWDGKQTLYDAGTGVIPAMRRRGVSDAIFEMMIPVFRKKGIEQCLLEVITTNHGAIRLYEKLGFHKVRELALLQCDGPVKVTAEQPRHVDIHPMNEPDWDHLSTFWDGKPSWQNSIAAIERSFPLKRILGAFINGEYVGYIIFSANFGRVAQLAVAQHRRNQGVGTALVQQMQAETADGYSLQVINIDKSLATAMDFFRNRGFYERLAQFEMVKPM